MKKFCIIFNFVFLAIIFNSCNWFNPKIRCKDFDKTLLEWIPYSINDTLYFIDTLNNRYKMIVHRIWLEHKTSYSKRTDCGGCEDQWGVEISGKSDSLKTKLSYSRYEQNNPNENYMIESNGKILYLSSYDSRIDFIDSLLIKGQSFKNVKTVRNSVGNDIKIILSKNLGIIMIKFGDIELYNQKFAPIFEISLKSFNYTESNCD
jgi:hypothetical protein